MLVPQDTPPERMLVRGSIVRPSVETCGTRKEDVS